MATSSTDNIQSTDVNGLNDTNTGNATMSGDATTTTAPGLSADEIALYDRQIRLWGAKAQESIRSANILLVSLRALGTEIAKNLTLAGISSLTIIDEDTVTEDDLGAQYFLREEDVGQPVSIAICDSSTRASLTCATESASRDTKVTRTEPASGGEVRWRSPGEGSELLCAV